MLFVVLYLPLALRHAVGATEGTGEAPVAAAEAQKRRSGMIRGARELGLLGRQAQQRRARDTTSVFQFYGLDPREQSALLFPRSPGDTSELKTQPMTAILYWK